MRKKPIRRISLAIAAAAAAVELPPCRSPLPPPHRPAPGKCEKKTEALNSLAKQTTFGEMQRANSEAFFANCMPILSE